MTAPVGSPSETCPLDPSASPLVGDSVRFTLSLYKEIASIDNANIFLSPISIFCALGMTYFGARGVTQQQMNDTMFLRNVDPSSLGCAFMLLCTKWSQLNVNPSSYDLYLANRIYLDEEFYILPDYAYEVRTYFDSSLKEVDFR